MQVSVHYAKTHLSRLLDLAAIPEPPDVADALAIAICHLHIAATLERQQSAAR